MSCDPANLGSADADLVGLGDDGQDYIIKTVEKTPDVPASEWFCHCLAELCGIAVPKISVLLINGKKPAFGSRFESGFEKNGPVVLDIVTGRLKANMLAERLSAIYAYDLFVHNDDRHVGNYMFTPGMKGYSVKAYDFSRAWLHHGWPLPELPMAAHCNTVRWFRDLMKHHNFQMAPAEAVLNHLSQIPVEKVSSIHDEIPPDWLSQSRRKEIVGWWAIESKNRIERIRGGLKDGSLL